MGMRLRESPVFLARNLARYRRRSARDAETYPDHSLVSAHAGTKQFYESWPSEVVLESGEKLVNWRLTLTSRHCPFCKPRVRCDSLKMLLDHLDHCHHQFWYRARRVDDAAVVSLRLARGEPDTDPMFIVHTEGYVISARMRQRYPNYVQRVSRRGTEGYPFVVKPCKIPKEYGGYIEGAPGTGVGGRLPAAALNATNGKVRIPVAVEMGNGMEKTGDGKDDGRGVKRKCKESAFKTALQDNASTKRRMKDDPDGMDNAYTKHFRKVMFGKNARNKLAGAGVPALNDIAARGKLFHSVSNMPLDVTRFNDGYDSDLEGVDEWVREMQDDQIDEVVDMLAVEKYYFKMWNQYVRDVGVNGDRQTFDLYMGFVTRFGSELKRMKCEAVLVMQIVRSWKFGTLDADGVMRIMRRFGECERGVSGRVHDDLRFVSRLVREYGLQPFLKSKYGGPRVSARADGKEREVFESGVHKFERWAREIVRQEGRKLGSGEGSES